jgi:hypothetical protein
VTPRLRNVSDVDGTRHERSALCVARGARVGVRYTRHAPRATL